MDDLVIVAARKIGGGNSDVDTVTHFFDGINKAAWGVLGFVSTPGTVQTKLLAAKKFKEIGSTSAKFGRLIPLNQYKLLITK